MEPVGPVNILVKTTPGNESTTMFLHSMDREEGKNEKTPRILKAEDEDIVEGRRGLIEPLGPVNILVKVMKSPRCCRRPQRTLSTSGTCQHPNQLIVKGQR